MILRWRSVKFRSGASYLDWSPGLLWSWSATEAGGPPPVVLGVGWIPPHQHWYVVHCRRR